MPAPRPSTGRIRALDWHRGLAVLVMVETHVTNALIHPSHDADALRGFLTIVNGLVAPSFVFAAGFSLAMVSCRAAASPEDRRGRAVKSLLRIAEVLAVANLLKAQMWPVFREPSWWLRVDILSCIACSLLVLWACVFSLGNRPRTVAAAMAALAAAVFALAPWSATWSGLGPLQHVVNSSTGSPFPVLPWAGFAFLGAAAGALMSIPGSGPGLLLGSLAAMVAAGAAAANSEEGLSRLCGRNAWTIAWAGAEIWKVAAIALVLRGAELFGEARGWAMRNGATWTLELFGTSSLAAFYFHETILFGAITHVAGGALARHCGWSAVAAITLGLIVATALLILAWEPVDRRLPWKARGKAPGRAGR